MALITVAMDAARLRQHPTEKERIRNKMAHLIDEILDACTTNDGNAWHGLDKKKDYANMTENQFPAEVGMDYQINVEALYRQDIVSDQRFAMVPDAYGIFAEGVDEMFKLVAERHVPVQPATFASMAHRLANRMGGKIVSTVTLLKRRVAAISIDLGKAIELPGGDALHRYVTAYISWDGSKPFRIVSNTFRTVCNNTFPSPECPILWEKTKHGDIDIDSVVDFAASYYDRKVAENQQKFADVLGKLAETPFDPVAGCSLNRFASVIADGKATMGRIIDLSECDKDAGLLDKCLTATLDLDAWNNVRTSGLSKIGNQIIAEALGGIGSDLTSARGTLWGLLNGYTAWADHSSTSMEGPGRKTDPEKAQADLLTGKFDQQKQDSLLLLSAIANTQNIAR